MDLLGAMKHLITLYLGNYTSWQLIFLDIMRQMREEDLSDDLIGQLVALND